MGDRVPDTLEPETIVDLTLVALRLDTHGEERMSRKIGTELRKKAAPILCPNRQVEAARLTHQQIPRERSPLGAGPLEIETRHGCELLLGWRKL